ncbi:hypothetical protein HDU80_006635 [Chytriomyces hyalinus]|nr:hypothetical protein HDU80_006635 [Chytriomyces hyalinus]
MADSLLAANQIVINMYYIGISIQAVCVTIFAYQVIVCETSQSPKKVTVAMSFSALNCTLMAGMMTLMSFYTCNAISCRIALEGGAIQPTLIFGSDLSMALAAHSNFLFSWWRSSKIIRLSFKQHFKHLEYIVMILCVVFYAPVGPAIAVLINPEKNLTKNFWDLRAILFGILASTSAFLDLMFVVAYGKYLHTSGLRVDGDVRFRLISVFGISSSFWNLTSMAVFVSGVAMKTVELQIVIAAVGQLFASGCVVSLLGMKIALYRVGERSASSTKDAGLGGKNMVSGGGARESAPS